jgi:fructoselysine/glucoselysine PTS system EIID component
MTTNSDERKLTDKDLRKVFWRSCMLDSSWNYERQQNLGYSFAMTPVVKRLYEDGSEEQRRAYHRGLDFMAVTPQLSTLLMGINAAMEEENANNEDFDDSSIVAVKTSLMGPLAGIGDSLIAGTLRIIATGVAIGFSQQGSLLGPVLLLLLFNIPGFAIRWLGMKYGYRYGSSFIKNAAEDGLMEKVSYAAGIVGLMAIGGMVASYVSFNPPIMVGTGDFAQPLTGYLDMIMPCLTQLGLFGLMYWILGRKGVKTVWVLAATIVCCIAGCWIGTLL